MKLGQLVKNGASLLAVLALSNSLAARGKAIKSCAQNLESARNYYDNLRFDDTAKALDVVALDKTCTKDQRADGLRLLGMTRVVLNDETGAKQAFIELLQLDPGAKLDPGLSPKMTHFFAKTREDFIASWQVRFKTKPRFDLCPQAEEQKEALKAAGRSEYHTAYHKGFACLKATLLKADSAPAVNPVLFSRSDPGQAYSVTTVQLFADGHLEAKVPLSQATEKNLFLQYYLRVDGPNSQNLVQAGNEKQPLVWRWQAPDEQKNWLADYRVWLVAGSATGLVAAAVLTTLAINASSAPPDESSLGTYSLSD